MTVGAAKPLHPEGLYVPFKISLDIAVSPDTQGQADEAADWSWPRVLLAELEKGLYIHRHVQ